MSALHVTAYVMMSLALVIALLSGQVLLVLAVATAALGTDFIWGWDLTRWWRRRL